MESVAGFTGVMVKSRMVPFALSCTIKKLEQKATVTQETAKIDEISWPATRPSMSEDERVRGSGMAAVRLL